ncbi:hypothetical protein B0H19DRAFT_1366199 [Mycena capillaripes]|nr:hypothetical protein B0H19DRAFT_1366199 [Mycena capillaripes]
MSSSSQESLVAAASFSSTGDSAMYVVFGLVAQTFVFGLYTLLICLSTRMLLKRGLKALANWVLLLIILFMYLLSTAYLAYTIVYAVALLRARIDAPSESPISDYEAIAKWSPVINAVAMLNFLLSDGVVIWRAWVICQHRMRRYIWVTIGFLVLTSMAVFTMIGFRIVAFVQFPDNGLNKIISLTPGLDILQLSSWTLSLVSNLSATAVVAVTAWRHRRIMHNAFTEKEFTSNSDRILGLIVEIGVFYCLSTLITLLSSLLQLPHGTLGDLYGPISIQIAGAYPPVVILLVGMNRSFSETTFLDPLSAATAASLSAYPVFGSTYTSPTTTVGGPEPTTSITGPDIIHPLAKITSTSSSKPIPSRFSDASVDTRQQILGQLQKTAFV